MRQSAVLLEFVGGQNFDAFVELAFAAFSCYEVLDNLNCKIPFVVWYGAQVDRLRLLVELFVLLLVVELR